MDKRGPKTRTLNHFDRLDWHRTNPGAPRLRTISQEDIIATLPIDLQNSLQKDPLNGLLTLMKYKRKKGK